MTLHWWMHWFWVTTLLTLQHCSGRALAAPQSEELQHITTDIEPEPNRPSNRQGRAMYFTKTPPVTSTTNRPTAVLANETKPTENMTISRNDTDPRNNVTLIVNATQGIVHPSVNWTPINGTDTTRTTSLNNTKREETTKNATESTVAPIKTNATEVSSTTLAPTKKRNNLTRHPDIKEIDTSIEGVAESRIVTEKPLSLETSYLQTIIPPSIESSRRINDQGSYEQGGMDTGAIAGISFAALVLTALAGSTAFVLYRRRYLNKPQTLNDKCSNPDSSGYLDDSTIRDNSEEMYSLDNDSFLNSLEAMTIQNYWTDTVKHTKL